MSKKSHPHSLSVEKYDTNQLASLDGFEAYIHPHYLVAFWEERIDPTGDGETYWHQISYILGGAKNVVEAIEWEKENAHGRPSATFGLFRENIHNIPEPGTWPKLPEDQSAPDLVLRLHGAIPQGTILDENNFFEFTTHTMVDEEGS
ncbi:MAG: hypothetical protein Q4A31_07265 [Corynebacterium sp.]|uniref:hypothetical protein n=1 Tax=Corynebacterium sp. TaxID=1720 RepID=UPI0026DD13AA|nr:hypothetical protein [Corynebacterium sp.]MDO4761700.1 hypothetical protein [Corynebacterium sp.]